MYDLNELESKWRIYRRKKIKNILIPILSTVVVALLVISAATVMYTQSGSQNDIKTQQVKEKNNTVATDINTTAQPKTELESEKQTAQKETKQDEKPKDSIEPKTVVLEKMPEPKKTDEKPIFAKQQKIDIELKETKTLEVLEERYSRHKSADTAAMIASEHYKSGDYQKAYKWAISANNLDAKNEKSWIVFAESANKLGKKEEAVSALENYIRSSQSDAAKNALLKIKNHE